MNPINLNQNTHYDNVQSNDSPPTPTSPHEEDNEKRSEKKAGRRKINIEFIDDKSRRHITFSKRKSGIMKKAYELSTLTGTQVLLLVASETGHVYTFATPKLQPLITKQEGKTLIQTCLNTPDTPTTPIIKAPDISSYPSSRESHQPEEKKIKSTAASPDQKIYSTQQLLQQVQQQQQAQQQAQQQQQQQQQQTQQQQTQQQPQQPLSQAQQNQQPLFHLNLYNNNSDSNYQSSYSSQINQLYSQQQAQQQAQQQTQQPQQPISQPPQQQQQQQNQPQQQQQPQQSQPQQQSQQSQTRGGAPILSTLPSPLQSSSQPPSLSLPNQSQSYSPPFSTTNNTNYSPMVSPFGGYGIQPFSRYSQLPSQHISNSTQVLPKPNHAEI
eukprot:gene6624-8195_t